jgi:hypothetical protein
LLSFFCEYTATAYGSCAQRIRSGKASKYGEGHTCSREEILRESERERERKKEKERKRKGERERER